jgi:hypothetical protein
MIGRIAEAEGFDLKTTIANQPDQSLDGMLPTVREIVAPDLALPRL